MNHSSKPTPLGAKAAIALSLMLSVALSVLAVRAPKNPAPHSVVIETNFIASAPVMKFEEIRIPVLVTNRFHWREIESTDFAEYAANLRRVGCPERTVGDILRAELRSIYKARNQALPDLRWGGAAQTNLAPGELSVQEQRFLLKQEYWNQLQQLNVALDPLGDLSGERLETMAIFHFFTGPVSSEEKFNQLVMAIARADAEEDRRRGLPVYTNEPAARPISELFAADVRRFLSASEFEEMAARSVTLRLLNGGSYSEVLQLAPGELREIAVLQTRDDPRLMFLDSIGDPESEPDFGARKTNNVEAVLGPDRARLFWLANDSEFKSAHEFTAKEKLPVAAAVQLHDLRKLVADELKQTAFQSDSQSNRTQRMLQIQAEAQSAARQILGNASYEKFLGAGGYWLTNKGGS